MCRVYAVRYAHMSLELEKQHAHRRCTRRNIRTQLTRCGIMDTCIRGMRSGESGEGLMREKCFGDTEVAVTYSTRATAGMRGG